MPFATTWMDLEVTILSEVSQRKTYDIPYRWNLKTITQQNVFCEIEMDSQT